MTSKQDRHDLFWEMGEWAYAESETWQEMRKRLRLVAPSLRKAFARGYRDFQKAHQSGEIQIRNGWGEVIR